MLLKYKLKTKHSFCIQLYFITFRVFDNDLESFYVIILEYYFYNILIVNKWCNNLYIDYAYYWTYDWEIIKNNLKWEGGYASYMLYPSKSQKQSNYHKYNRSKIIINTEIFGFK